MRELITTATAALRLGISVRRVQNAILAKLLRAERVGRDWLIDARDLADFQPRQPGRRRKKS